MKYYCNGCKTVFEDLRCPYCGKKKVTEAQPEDVCFLTEQGQIWSSALRDALDDNSIPYTTKNVLGAGMAMKIGMMNEKVIFFVYYKDLDAASDIVKALFSNDNDEDIVSTEE